jgi:uncharacterized phosphosugar-binding protein
LHGHLVVAIAPPTAERELRKAGCDRFLSNWTHEEGGVLNISGAGPADQICPASGVVGNVIMQMLLAQVAESLCDAGETPFFMCNPCRVNGEYYNTAVRHFVAARGW